MKITFINLGKAFTTEIDLLTIDETFANDILKFLIKYCLYTEESPAASINPAKDKLIRFISLYGEASVNWPIGLNSSEFATLTEIIERNTKKIIHNVYPSPAPIISPNTEKYLADFLTPEQIFIQFKIQIEQKIFNSQFMSQFSNNHPLSPYLCRFMGVMDINELASFQVDLFLQIISVLLEKEALDLLPLSLEELQTLANLTNCNKQLESILKGKTEHSLPSKTNDRSPLATWTPLKAKRTISREEEHNEIYGSTNGYEPPPKAVDAILDQSFTEALTEIQAELAEIRAQHKDKLQPYASLMDKFEQGHASLTRHTINKFLLQKYITILIEQRVLEEIPALKLPIEKLAGLVGLQFDYLSLPDVSADFTIHSPYSKHASVETVRDLRLPLLRNVILKYEIVANYYINSGIDPNRLEALFNLGAQIHEIGIDSFKRNFAEIMGVELDYVYSEAIAKTSIPTSNIVEANFVNCRSSAASGIPPKSSANMSSSQWSQIKSQPAANYSVEFIKQFIAAFDTTEEPLKEEQKNILLTKLSTAADQDTFLRIAAGNLNQDIEFLEAIFLSLEVSITHKP